MAYGASPGRSWSRIGIKQRGLILGPDGDADGALAWSWGWWGLVPPGAREAPPYQLNNARSDKLGSWLWNAVQHQGCLVPKSGFCGPEKAAREKRAVPWSYHSMQDGRPFLIAGLSAEAHDPAIGVVADTHKVIITDANATICLHDRMPVILAPADARRWSEPQPLPAASHRRPPPLRGTRRAA